MERTNGRGAAGTPDPQRAALVNALRIVADALEKHPDDVPMPYEPQIKINAFLFSKDPKAAMTAARRAFAAGSWDKEFRENGEYGSYIDMIGDLGGLKVKLTAYRDAVCRRVVTGTEDREVEEIVRPAEVRTVTKPVEIVEWVCEPVTAPAAGAAPETADAA